MKAIHIQEGRPMPRKLKTYNLIRTVKEHFQIQGYSKEDALLTFETSGATVNKVEIVSDKLILAK